MKKFDTILVLGTSTHLKHFKKRVEKAVALYSKGVAPKIILSGRFWGGLPRRPKYTEAHLMKKYALKLDIPPKDIIIEEKALNTAGNFFFTKKDILKPRHWKNILVITHRSHFAKSKYLAKKIFGPSYSVHFTADGFAPEGHGSTGHISLADVKKFLGHMKDGDDHAQIKLFKAHPHYKRYRVKIV